MQPYAWLVKDIKHTYKRRAYLGRESYSLRLSSRERSRLSGQREILKSDARKEAESCSYLLDYFRGNNFFRALGVEVVYKFKSLLHRFRAKFVYVYTSHGNRKRVRAEAFASAHGTRSFFDKLLVIVIVVPHRHSVFHHLDDALKDHLLMMLLAAKPAMDIV